MKYLLITLMFMLPACGVVTNEDYKKAEITCSHFGGVSKVYLRGTKVQCSDGTIIKISGGYK